MKRAFGMAITGLAGGLWLKTLVLAVALSSFGVSHAQFLRQPRGPRQVVKSGLLQKPDSAAIARRDSILVAGLVDSLLKLPTDSLPSVSDSIRLMLPDTIRQSIFPDSLQKDTVALTEKQLRRQQRRENRKPLLSDSMALRKVCWASLVLPGFGQIYNKQYWKLPILYGTFGASLGMFIHENNKYKPLKKQFDAMTDQGLNRTPELDAIQTQMIRHNTWRQILLGTTIASYLYFIGDAAVCYATNEVSSVNKATTLSTICPGAGQIYNKSYWKVPIVLGGIATMGYVINFNNRGLERFKLAYDLVTDGDPNTIDEFNGRYTADYLKKLRDNYRRNRDLCIIITAGLYLLNIIDAHVDAHMKEYDISDDLSMNLEPTMVNMYTMRSGTVNGVGFAFKLAF